MEEQKKTFDVEFGDWVGFYLVTGERVAFRASSIVAVYAPDPGEYTPEKRGCFVAVSGMSDPFLVDMPMDVVLEFLNK